MIATLWSRVHEVIEKLGLDWFVLLSGKQAFEDTLSPNYPTTLSETREKFSGLQGDKLDDAIEYCSDCLDREDDRSDKIESKAFTLVGITGIATGFITGFAGLLLDQDKMTDGWILVPAVILYILVVISLMWTIYLAVKVVTVGDYKFTYPAAQDILEIGDTSPRTFKREYVASLFYSFARNQQVVNRKATYLGGAQLWFRNSVVLLLVLTLLLGLYAPFSSSSTGVQPSPSTVGGTATPQATTTTQPTATVPHSPQPTFTPTITIPTVTPTLPPVTSSPTSTHTPSSTPPNKQTGTQTIVPTNQKGTAQPTP
jgi:hypothetical protein